MKKLALKDFPDDEGSLDTRQAEDSDEEEAEGTGVQTSQLRHFVIQVRKSTSRCELYTDWLNILYLGVCAATIAHRSPREYEARCLCSDWSQGVHGLSCPTRNAHDHC